MDLAAIRFVDCWRDSKNDYHARYSFACRLDFAFGSTQPTSTIGSKQTRTIGY